MKKLNRKGFTLIELLAIIVILAIIMVVTIPTILSSINTATAKTFKNSADAIEKWVSDEYVLAVTGQMTNDSENKFIKICTATNKYCATEQTITGDAAKGIVGTTNSDDAVSKADAFVKASGQVPTNYAEIKIKVDPNTNRVCVKLKASTEGDFAGVAYDQKNNYMEGIGTADASGNYSTYYMKSNGC